MIVHSIALDFFRNYVHLDARFSPEVNVIYGENAQGKTNLLEAVAYLSTASSHRARYDRELIQFGVDHAFVKAEVSARGRDFTLEARLGRGVRRQLYSNGVRLKSAGELSGVLNTVLFCPEDLYLIREGAATRRRFLDGCICQLRPKYAEALAEYRRLYEHKVRILRGLGGAPLPAGHPGRVQPAHGPDRGPADPLPGPLRQAPAGGDTPHPSGLFRRAGEAGPGL